MSNTIYSVERISIWRGGKKRHLSQVVFQQNKGTIIPTYKIMPDKWIDAYLLSTQYTFERHSKYPTMNLKIQSFTEVKLPP